MHNFTQEQFALEYVVHDFFTQFCGRTADPEEADFFYLPIIRDVNNFKLMIKLALSVMFVCRLSTGLH